MMPECPGQDGCFAGDPKGLAPSVEPAVTLGLVQRRERLERSREASSGGSLGTLSASWKRHVYIPARPSRDRIGAFRFRMY